MSVSKTASITSSLPVAEKSPPKLPESIIKQMILPFAPHDALVKFFYVSKSAKKLVIDSLKFRTELTWKELGDLLHYNRMGIALKPGMLASLRVIKGDGAEKVSDHDLEIICAACPNLDVIDLGSNNKITTRGFRAIGEKCPNLRCFNINPDRKNAYLRKGAIAALTSGCHQLEYLGLNCWGLSQFMVLHPYGISTSDLEAIAKNCPNLRELHIHMYEYLDWTAALTLLGKGCPKLISFEGRCPDLKLLTRFPQLRVLNIGPCREHSAEDLQIFLKACPLMEELGTCQEYGDDHLAAIGQWGANLKRINIFHNQKFTARGLEALIKGCPLLTEIAAYNSHLDNDQLLMIADGAPHLESLDIRHCFNSYPDGFSEKAVEALVTKCPHLKKLKWWWFNDATLRCLTNSRCNFTKVDFDSEIVSAKELIAFFQKNHELTHINIGACPNVDDQVLIAISQSCPKLREIIVPGGNPKITPAGIAALGHGCPQLQALHLYSFINANDFLLKAIADNFPNLVELRLSTCRKWPSAYSPDGFKLLGRACKKLEDLEVICCQLTDEHMQAIAETFHALRRIRYDQNKASESAKVLLIKSCPHIVNIKADYQCQAE